ncbi:Transcriptional regulator, MerR family [Rhodovastum atsumiense]|uniref:Helix-turn-helix domain-containing protein n=1 Tax=Rhodovastum atsumiense TaxID=504468 RepID=A0A5M6IZL3_9PROT|nr:XRE family transcriptional regulator [Rhodovastum atsumiense]KAA5613409.1 helix-turn-helix domain-containing protein [Rhodovastum atsumiense]CAH2603134.1 Transcriptional regulator, MerR family [Rhodovastum atsumiense]
MDGQDAETGRLIRQVRKRAGKTLAVVARDCDCTVSFLSKLETGHTQASLNMLHRIAHALGVNIRTLVPTQAGGASRIVRAGTRRFLAAPHIRGGDGIRLEMLSGQGGEDVFQVNLHHVAPGGRSDGQIVHDGDEFIFVLAGEIDLELGPETHRLGAGDAAFFPSREPHGYSNPGSGEAVVLWLNSPPTY